MSDGHNFYAELRAFIEEVGVLEESGGDKLMRLDALAKDVRKERHLSPGERRSLSASIREARKAASYGG